MLSRTKVASCLISAAALLGPAVSPISAHADVTQCAPITIGGEVAGCLSVSAIPSLQPNGDPVLEIAVTLQVYGQQPATRSETAVVPIAETEGDVPIPCTAAGKQATRSGEWGDFGRVYGIGYVHDPFGTFECDGLVGLTIVPGGGGQAASVTPPTITTTTAQPLAEPYNVPQICLTTTPGACVGPFDGTISPEVPEPSVTAPGASQGDPTQLCLGVTGAGTWIPFTMFSGPFYPDVDVWGYYDGQNCLPYVPVGLPAPDLSRPL